MASAARAITRSVHGTIKTPLRRLFVRASCAVMTRATGNMPTVVTETATAVVSQISLAVSWGDRNPFYKLSARSLIQVAESAAI